MAKDADTFACRTLLSSDSSLNCGWYFAVKVNPVTLLLLLRGFSFIFEYVNVYGQDSSKAFGQAL